MDCQCGMTGDGSKVYADAGGPSASDASVVPAKQWLDAQATTRGPNQPFNQVICFSGDLTTLEQVQIANWIDNNIPSPLGAPGQWIGGLAHAHAKTLVLAHRLGCDLSSAWTSKP